jgi:hypothetical protein
MGVRSEAFQQGDVYIDFPQEDVMFHFVKNNGKIFRKFYNDPLEDEIQHTSTLFAEARTYGVTTTAERYARGGLRPEK